MLEVSGVSTVNKEINGYLRYLHELKYKFGEAFSGTSSNLGNSNLNNINLNNSNSGVNLANVTGKV
jgi:hypothetical protein